MSRQHALTKLECLLSTLEATSLTSNTGQMILSMWPMDIAGEGRNKFKVSVPILEKKPIISKNAQADRNCDHLPTHVYLGNSLPQQLAKEKQKAKETCTICSSFFRRSSSCNRFCCFLDTTSVKPSSLRFDWGSSTTVTSGWSSMITTPVKEKGLNGHFVQLRK